MVSSFSRLLCGVRATGPSTFRSAGRASEWYRSGDHLGARRVYLMPEVSMRPFHSTIPSTLIGALVMTIAAADCEGASPFLNTAIVPPGTAAIAADAQGNIYLTGTTN